MKDSGKRPILKVNNLVVKFGENAAVDGMSIEIFPGELRALIGANGAGKTTALNAISGAVKPAGGQIVFLDKDITGLPPHIICRRGIARTFQLPNILPELTVRENVWLGINSRERIPWQPLRKINELKNKEVDDFCEIVNLQGNLNDMAGNLSHGDQKLLEIAIALSLDGQLLLLDEPTQGVSPKEIEKFVKVVKEVAKQKTVLMIEHNIDVILKTANCVTVLDHGKVIAEDIPSQIINNDRVRRVYLGTA